jgi:very-short-patch-repair endonuclease
MPSVAEQVRGRLEAARRELLDLTTRNRLLDTPRGVRARVVEIVDRSAEDVFRWLVREKRRLGFQPRPEPPSQPAEPAQPLSMAPLPPDRPSEEADRVTVPSPIPVLPKAAAAHPAPSKPPPGTAPQADGPGGAVCVEGASGVGGQPWEEELASPDAQGVSEAAASHTESQAASHAASQAASHAELPGLNQGGEEGACDQAAEGPSASNRAAPRFEYRLPTLLPAEQLQKRLLSMYYDARTFEEEQGVNVLYLGMGLLQWYEPDKGSRPRHAPLLLVPVELSRKTVRSGFRITALEDDIATNISLQAKLRDDFQIDLPDLRDDDDAAVSDYFRQVGQAIADQPLWQVLPDAMVLGFFSFSRFLMYRDLDPNVWPAESRLDEHELICGLLSDGGFACQPPLCGDDDPLDPLLPPEKTLHVVDADSSQALAIEECCRGRNLVIQGPPGTGKSQTIANMIAAAVKGGKKVLFVAEKMAALEVVQRRLENIGLGQLCLELHSHKANKRAVHEQLRATLQQAPTPAPKVTQQAPELQAARDALNGYVAALHRVQEPFSKSAWEVLGELIRLRASGVRSADFSLPAATTWTPAAIKQRAHLLHELVRLAEDLGPPETHPWRGVGLASVLPMDLERLARELPGVEAKVRELTAAAGQLAATVRCPPPATLRQIEALIDLVRRLAAAPPADRQALAGDVWRRQRAAIGALVRNGLRYAKCRKRLAHLVSHAAWSTDVRTTRAALAAHGRSLFRWFHREYRKARAALRGVLAPPRPKTLARQLEILDTLILGQDALQAIDDADALGQAAFGSRWGGPPSKWPALAAIERWERDCRQAGLPNTFRESLAALANAQAAAAQAGQLERLLRGVQGQVEALFGRLQLHVPHAFDVPTLGEVAISDLASRLAAWQAEREGLVRWVEFYTRWAKLAPLGLGELAERVRTGAIAPADLVDCFQMALHEELLREILRREARLAEFESAAHEQLRQEFQRLDVQRIAQARREVAEHHRARIPSGERSLGEVGLVRREIEKKRRHLPLRQLLTQAGRAVQAIKPVFMMSPISVAQFLEPGELEFDLLLIDEASQVRPVDALGAIGRARQMIVVGDDRQLPPTRFFQKLCGDEDLAEADEFAAGDLESILGLCVSQNVPQRMLRWHYRSRHHSLIAVSNREFYDQRLLIVPNPDHDPNQEGLRFHHLPQAVFDRGGSATNRDEARAVALAVMEHARRCPKLTLGVGAFSMRQRDAILDELEILRPQAPELEMFFASDALEPFFVKNLENIQGDERDVVFISVGYGRDQRGALTMNFGPLNAEGGERRLNVLITRARRRCEVFSSITADDVDLTRTHSRGAAALKTFLQYAQRGELDVARPQARQPDSPFEIEVARALEGRGYRVVPQVGVAGFFIDLAVVDPHQPGRFLLGIECDGVSYHAARWARDRDRLRDQLLADRGWTIHRIWSKDWLQRPESELRRLMAAIEQAAAGGQAPAERPRSGSRAPEALRNTWRGGARSARVAQPRSSASDSVSDAAAAPEAVEARGEEKELRRDDTPALRPPLDVLPYKVASFKVRSEAPLSEMPLGRRLKLVQRILKIEGPLHEGMIVERVAQLTQQPPATRQLRQVVQQALAEGVRRGRFAREGPFYRLHDGQDVPLRKRDRTAPPATRRPDRLPPAEIRKALCLVVEEHLGVHRDEAVQEAARLLGFRTLTRRLREVVEAQIDRLVTSGRLKQRNEKLYPP